MTDQGIGVGQAVVQEDIGSAVVVILAGNDIGCIAHIGDKTAIMADRRRLRRDHATRGEGCRIGRGDQLHRQETPGLQRLKFKPSGFEKGRFAPSTSASAQPHNTLQKHRPRQDQEK